MSNAALSAVIDAVAVDGFRPRLTAKGLSLEGEVKVGRALVPLVIEFRDLTLASSPRILLRDTSGLSRKVVPHLDDTGEFCVVDRRTHIFDRYRAPELTRGLIIRAAEILERGMTKAGTQEIADEFPSYWSSTFVEIPDDPASKAEAGAPPFGFLTTAARLSFDADQIKPETLGDLLDWSGRWDGALPERIIARLMRLSPADPMLVIDAPNACAIVRVRVSGRGPTFVATFRRPGSWERFLKTAAARALRIERHQGRRVDLATILGTGYPEGKAPLAGRRVVQIGCGAIGGYVARMLVQMGAGIGVPLTLIDPDRLSRQNVRRHQLGLGNNGELKVQACADEIGRAFPGVDIRAVAAEAQSQVGLLGSADLVVDVTGEQELSEWLNAWALSRQGASSACPAIFYGWIAGHGAAAQSFLMLDKDQACYRCLQPDLTERARFDPLKDIPPEPVAACGEQPSTPYGPAASTAAASLVANHVDDWARGRPHPLLRTVRIDWDATVKRDPKNPEKASRCPACASASA